jgi:hypothetical protein
VAASVPAAAVLSVVLLGAAACGGAAHPHAAATAVSTPPTTPAAPASSAASTPAPVASATLISPLPPSPTASPTPVAPPATVAAVARCQPGTLTARLTAMQGGVGHLGEALVLRNTGRTSCYLDGYVGLQLESAAHRALPTRVERGSGYLYHDPGPSYVLVPPGQSASAGVEWDQIPGPQDGSSCPTAAYLGIIPPDDTAMLTTTASIQACNRGELVVTAIQAGPDGPTS